jgi:hypothetical protein
MIRAMISRRAPVPDPGFVVYGYVFGSQRHQNADHVGVSAAGQWDQTVLISSLHHPFAGNSIWLPTAVIVDDVERRYGVWITGFSNRQQIDLPLDRLEPGLGSNA